jgi:hypothetical protein
VPATVYIDGVDVTSVSVSGSSTRRLNRPSVATVKIPMAESIGGVGSLLKIEFNGTLHHHGRVLLCETDTQEDTGYTTYNSTDPLELWAFRPVRDADGDFSKPTIIEDYQTGPQIVEQMILNSEDPGGIPGTAEGPLFLSMGSFETGGEDLTGAPTDWPMTMADLASLLISTGELDIVLTPIDSGGNMAQIDCYNGDYGTDLTGSVVFQYGMGARNVRRLRWNQDMTKMVNKLWYYLGPRVRTPEDIAGDQHWRANVQGDDPAFNPAGSPVGAWATSTGYSQFDVVTNTVGSLTISFIASQAHTSSALTEPGVGIDWQQYWAPWMVPPGGANSPPASATNNQLGVLRMASRNQYGVRMAIRIYDARGDESTVGRVLYRRLWQVESWLAAQPLELVHITPTRETEIGTFDIGDLITVEADSAVRGGFSGAQRIYEYTISWEAEGSTLELSELQTSVNSEGF